MSLSERAAKAAKIAQQPELYKICEGCDSIVVRDANASRVVTGIALTANRRRSLPKLRFWDRANAPAFCLKICSKGGNDLGPDRWLGARVRHSTGPNPNFTSSLWGICPRRNPRPLFPLRQKLGFQGERRSPDNTGIIPELGGHYFQKFPEGLFATRVDGLANDAKQPFAGIGYPTP